MSKIKVSSFRNARSLVIRCVLVTCLAGGLNGCNPIDKIGEDAKEAARLIDHAAVNLGNNGTIQDIEATIRDLLSEITAFSSADFFSDVQNRLNQSLDDVTSIAHVAIASETDFVRSQVAFELESIKSVLSGKSAPKRKPVLSKSRMQLDMDDPNMRAFHIVGWNLDVASTDKKDYPIQIVDSAGTRRPVPNVLINYTGRYSLTINLAQGNGEHLLGPEDRKLSLVNFRDPYDVAIVAQRYIPRSFAHRHIPLGWTGDFSDTTLALDIHLMAFGGGTDIVEINRITFGNSVIVPDLFPRFFLSKSANDGHPVDKNLYEIGGPPYRLVLEIASLGRKGFPEDNLKLSLVPLFKW